MALRARREKGPTTLGVGSERASSRWPQIAKQNRSRKRAGGVRSCVGTRSASEECDLAKRGEAQEGSGEQAIGLVPDMSMEALRKI